MTTTNTSHNPPTGPHIGRYKIIREIARSNDIVYEASDPTMNRRIALKELNLPPNVTGAQKRERIERFYREAKAAGTLNHRNIVTIYEIGQDAGRHFIAMEYLEGQSLRTYLNVIGPPPTAVALQVALDLCDALGYAHSQGVIHRDVKPDNVHLIPPNNTVKLTDFGIARVLEEPSLTSTGQVFGTPSYMSPEQLSARSIDHRTDIFSLGVMLFEILTGKKPFQGDSIVAVTYQIMNQPPSFPSGMPAGLTAILRRALAKDPDQRYQNARVMAAEIRTELAFLGSAHHPRDTSYVTGKPVGDVQATVSSPIPSQQVDTSLAPHPSDETQYAPLPESQQSRPAPTDVEGPVAASSRRAYSLDETFASTPASTGAQGAARPSSMRTPVHITDFNLEPPPPARSSLVTLVVTTTGIAAILGIVIWAVLLAVDTSRTANLRLEATHAYDAGRDSYIHGDFDGALVEYRKALLFAPPESDDIIKESQRGMSLCYTSEGEQAARESNNTQATDDYLQAIKLDKYNALAHFDYAQIVTDPTIQLRELEASISADSGDPKDLVAQQARQQAATLYSELADKAVASGDMTDAVSYWRKVIQVSPTDPLADQARQRLATSGL